MVDEETAQTVSDRRRLVQDEGEEEPEVQQQPPQQQQDEQGSPAPFHRRHRWCLLISTLLVAIAIGHVVAVYFIYFRCHKYNGCETISVMALNTWGMPASLGSQYKTERMRAIRDELARGVHDIYLFEELWMQADHTTVASGVPEGFTMTGFRQLALSDCEGRIGPDLCSGLAIASRYPLEEVHFESYTEHGDIAKMFIDGEWLARKGVGRVRIKILNNVTVDVFVTHTAADPDQRYHDYTNEWYRVRQVKELMDTYVKKSTADVVILGGDFNAGPDFKEGEPYHMIRSYMKNSVEEIYYKLKAWLGERFSTYGNRGNTFSYMFDPIIYDYIFHRSNRDDVRVWTNWFDVPLLKLKLMLKDHKARDISFSDHEAVMAQIHVWKK